MYLNAIICFSTFSLLTVGSYIPWTYYGFYCHPTSQVPIIITIIPGIIITIIMNINAP